MRKLKCIQSVGLCLSLLFYVSLSFAQGDSILVSGHINGRDSCRLTLSFSSVTGQTQLYEKQVLNGKFAFHVKAQDEPVIANLACEAMGSISGRQASIRAMGIELIIYKSPIKLETSPDDILSTVVIADQENKEFAVYRRATAILIKQDFLIRREIMSLEKKDSILLRSLIDKGQRISRQIIAKQKGYIEDYPTSFTSLYFLSRMSNFYTADQYIAAYNNLSELYKHTSLAAKVNKKVESLKVTAAGTIAASFKGTTTGGKSFDLKSKRGKLVLLDFWGSWCKPCRMGQPHLKMLSDKYKNKGFEIIGVSNENNKTAVERRAASVKAMLEDGVDWINLLNKDDTDIDVVKTYLITGFPTKILLDEEGKVVLRVTASATDDLDKVLERYYNKRGRF
uniref:TlpA family protein disulfide reductase n=1 Tax=Pedobacter schmidteae TaxID=2201271 RepID=UPI000EAE0E1F|nr:TlpA disulfide reductase family protein [Pedobacter schmidteae]